MHQWTHQNEKHKTLINDKTQKILASTALLMMLTGCCRDALHNSGAADHIASFSQPEAANYHRNKYDDYYTNIRSTIKMTSNNQTKKSLEELYQHPVAQWLNSSTVDTRRLINENTQVSIKEGTIPIFVAYNIPNRDLGGEAAGGLSNGAEYNQWIEDISRTIDQTPAVLVLEPDALPGVTLIQSEAERQERISLLRDALLSFQKNKNLAVYLDVGHSNWLSVQKVVNLIKDVDSERGIVGGISLNVSSYRSEQENRNYAEEIADVLGRQLHVLIDNSRNGAPSTDNLQGWCNVDGQKLGNADRYYNTAQLVETAYIKTPGESDGRCGTSDKPAGNFDPKVLIDLATQ
jgi:endoglucanase